MGGRGKREEDREDEREGTREGVREEMGRERSERERERERKSEIRKLTFNIQNIRSHCPAWTIEMSLLISTPSSFHSAFSAQDNVPHVSARLEIRPFLAFLEKGKKERIKT